MTGREDQAVLRVLEPREPTSWAPVDLADALDGGDDLLPTVLRRGDGRALLYAGKVHTVSGESESLKSWLLLVACAEEVAGGRHVLWIDFEDSARSVASRMLALGTPRSDLLSRFHYVRPADPLSHLGVQDLSTALAHDPTLVVLDGVTEAMGLHGWNPLDNGDVAKFYALLPRKLASTGPAVALIDHVNKTRDNSNRFALGAQHKLAAVDGAAFIVDLVTPFGHGKKGLAKITVAKDRPGRVREHAQGNRIADLHLRSEADGSVFADLHSPDSSKATTGAFRPTVLMERVSSALELSPDGATGTSLEKQVTGKATGIRLAIAALVEDGYATATSHGTGQLYQSIKPYRDETS